MSPRTAEFMAEARERLAAARDAIDSLHFGVALGIAYYAMLYAARAALSERDLNAKTHGGTWALFSEQFVKSGVIDTALAGKTRDAERLRYETDYDAADVDREVAEKVLADAEQFVAEVAQIVETGG